MFQPSYETDDDALIFKVESEGELAVLLLVKLVDDESTVIYQLNDQLDQTKVASYLRMVLPYEFTYTVAKIDVIDKEKQLINLQFQLLV